MELVTTEAKLVSMVAVLPCLTNKNVNFELNFRGA